MDKFSEMSHAERIEYLASKVALAKGYDSPVLTVPIPDLEILLAEQEAKDKRIAELEQEPTIKHMRSVEESLICATDRVSELEAKLATPVRLTDERTLWAGEDDYDTGHVKGWNANRIEQAALLKKQGFTVEGDE